MEALVLEIQAVLEGGPADLPTELRNQFVTDGTDKIKVNHYGGHEHFERAPAMLPGPVSAGPAVYRWTMRTKVAE
ncbi:hypothetical protein Dvina_05680 [Dactylosporangium vinaceum]|nr:hypothetical protein Dvina_05680 [Dactylosporangium vinaceum]